MLTKKRIKTSQPPEILSRLDAAMDKSVFAILKIALFGLLISALATFLTHDVEFDFIDAFVLANVKKWVSVLALLLVTNVGLIYAFSKLLTRTTRPTNALKEKVVKAYQHALDQSSFNPHLNKQHEQLTR